MPFYIVALVFLLYFAAIYTVSRIVTRKDCSNEAFFTGNRKSPWLIVSYGMIGTILSGVTFMSVPGYVRTSQFTYLAMVLGNFAGIFIIAFILLPLYYRLRLTSIYSYLGERFGSRSEKSGAVLFILSRLMGSALRMYIVVFTIYEFSFKQIGLPFWLLTALILALILVYTFRGGIKSVIWTDVLQTTCLILAISGVLWILKSGMGESFTSIVKEAGQKGMTRVYDGNWKSSTFFWKQFAAGIAGMIAMTGLDQDMMQKNLSCNRLKESQKNMTLTAVLLFSVNLLFLILGVLLLAYAQRKGIVLPEKSDAIFATIAFSAGTFPALLFLLGLIAAGFSSADGTLASLTTAFCIDILGFEKRTDLAEARKEKIRKMVHLAFAVCFFLIIVIFRPFHSDSLIATIFVIAGYTYGPLLGLFCFGMTMKNRRVNDRAVPFIAFLSPVISFLFNKYSPVLLFGYKFGFEILLFNALLTCIALLIFSKKQTEVAAL